MVLLNVMNIGIFCRFYFDFSPTYVGCGLICPHLVNCSVLLGAIISWGFLWPFISTKSGDWYPAGLGSNDFKGLYGYKVLEIYLIQITYLPFAAGCTFNVNLSYPENIGCHLLQPKSQLYREMFALGASFSLCFYIFRSKNRRLQRVLKTENFLHRKLA